MYKALFIAPFVFNFYGGAEKVIKQINNIFIKKNFNIDYITNDNIGKAIFNYNYNLCEYDDNRFNNIIKDSHIILAFGFPSLYYLLCKDTNAKIIFVPFETVKKIDDSIKRKCLYILEKANIYKTIVISKYFKEVIESEFNIPSEWLRYNLSKEEIINIIPDNYIKQNIVFVPSRISPRKNIEHLILLAQKLSNYNINVILSGGLEDSIYPDYVRRLIEINKKNDNIIKFNKKSLSYNQMVNYYDKALCVISTSHLEGLGIFALEAINYLKPIISYDSIGIREICDSKENGIMIVGNIEEMARNILKLYCDDEYYNVIVKLIYQYKSKYNDKVNFEQEWNKIITNIIDLIG